MPLARAMLQKIAGELGPIVAAIEQSVAGGGFDDDVADALALVEKHQAVFIGDTGDVAAQLVGGVAHEINPIAFAEIPGIDAAITDLAVSQSEAAGEREDSA